MTRTPARCTQADLARAIYVLITDPGCVPDRKGPFRSCEVVPFLREAIAARPYSHLIVARIDGGHLDVEDGTQYLEIADGRSSSTAQKHRNRLKSIRADLARER